MPKKQNKRAAQVVRRECSDDDLMHLAVPSIPFRVLRGLTQLAKSSKRGSRANYVRWLLEQHVDEQQVTTSLQA